MSTDGWADREYQIWYRMDHEAAESLAHRLHKELRHTIERRLMLIQNRVWENLWGPTRNLFLRSVERRKGGRTPNA
jgi:hypothetical protein